MRPTGTQCRHSSVLKLRCNAATHPQHNFNIDQFEEIGIEVTKKLRAFYWFCRPHTIIGTVRASLIFVRWKKSTSYLNQMLLFCTCIIYPTISLFLLYVDHVPDTRHYFSVPPTNEEPRRFKCDSSIGISWGIIRLWVLYSEHTYAFSFWVIHTVFTWHFWFLVHRL